MIARFIILRDRKSTPGTNAIKPSKPVTTSNVSLDPISLLEEIFDNLPSQPLPSFANYMGYILLVTLKLALEL